ncbi:hypothetical protein H6F74_26650 [Trichocoleus sp. FACHB-90]|uniref:hypothetical protein n=1 Tax=Cyanophyceae TaxID=3028117 RepID=UPI001684C2E6|nr:hypothetical protein [Trichocoleus sp. FACHB-90]MBD1929786.1 hypothetical protein [Trichocoleus sp. FACHB-90]
MSTQTRIVLSAEVKPIVDEIKQVTSASSTSEVVSLMLTRYGKHFITWWLSNPHQNELAAAPVLPDEFVVLQTE